MTAKTAAQELSAQELDFVAWMDNLDLEEVNLLEERRETHDDFGTQQEPKLVDGEHKTPPPQKNLGWDTGE